MYEVCIMKEYEELSEIKKTKSKITIDSDFDSKLHRRQIAEQGHKNMMTFLKWVPGLTGIFLVFVAVLFLVVLPLVEMTLDYDTIWDAVQDWARAFAHTGRNLGIAILTLAIPSVLKFVYVLIKSHVPSEKDETDE